MKVLLLDIGLLSKEEHLLDAYRRIISLYPTVQFETFSHAEEPPANFPPNLQIRLIPQITFPASSLTRSLHTNPWMREAALLANFFAAQISGEAFDIIELSDSNDFGIFLRCALQKYEVRFQKLWLNRSDIVNEEIETDTLKRNLLTDLRASWQRSVFDLIFCLDAPAQTLKSSYDGKPISLRGDNESTHTDFDPVFEIACSHDEVRPLPELIALASTADATTIDMVQVWYGRLDLNPAEPSLSRPSPPPLAGAQPRLEDSLDVAYGHLSTAPETNAYEIQAKLKLLYAVNAQVRVDRLRVWNEIARLERMRGNTTHWATYQLRILRYLGRSIESSVKEVSKVLENNKFANESRALIALSESTDAALEYLRRTENENRSIPKYEYEIFEDRRLEKIPAVSIIVSMYNAANKLEFFLKKISAQTLFSSDQIEIILVDSDSPTDELRVWNEAQAALKLSTVYVRSPQRETIQTAWNRGISISRARYLCFLGVDETLRPDALEMLSKQLDDDASLDWVIGTSVGVAVDKNGEVLETTITYNRTDAEKDLVYLDTTQLSWVGALYRKDIHQRFGYYDGSFRAAGDTEFKNRLLRKLKTKAVPDVLGVFLNYPEERATENPLAEVEDLRAWYMHRSTAGVLFGFADRPAEDLETQLLRSLRYRKTYAQVYCTDFDYALRVSEALAIRNPRSQVLLLQDSLRKVVDAFKRLEFVEPFNIVNVAAAEANAYEILKSVEAEHRQFFGLADLDYALARDNRFCHYSGPWASFDPTPKNFMQNKFVWPA